jgi:hypothetical protein
MDSEIIFMGAFLKSGIAHLRCDPVMLITGDSQEKP